MAKKVKAYTFKQLAEMGYDHLEDVPFEFDLILDDRPIKYDIKNRKIVYPDEPGYDKLPHLNELAKEGV